MWGFSFFGKGEDQERLDEVEKILEEHQEDVGDEHLEDIAKAAKELRAVMDIEIARGAKGVKLLKRIEDISDLVLKNLEVRLTVDVIKDKGTKTKTFVQQFIVIGKELDAVRATKASKILEAHAVGLQEKLAEELYQQAVAAVKEVKDADTLLENMQKVLDAIAATHSQAPDSKTITDKLLKLCVVMARSLLQLAPVCLKKDPKNAIVMRDASDKLDDLAGKLVFVMGAVWDPAATPQLDTLVQNETTAVVTAVTGVCQAELDKGADGLNPTVFNPQLKLLEPWWPVVATIDGLGDKVQAVCEGIDANLVEAFGKFAAAGNTEVTDFMFSFAQEMDTITSHFTGIAIAESSLRSQLLGTSFFADAPKQVEQLGKQLEEPGCDISTTNLSLQMLETLVPLWDRSKEADAELPGKLSTVLDALETDVLEATPGADPATVEAFSKFALKYDELREKLGLESHNFSNKLLPHVAGASLLVVEVEMAKDEGRNSAAVLKAFESFSDPLLKSTLEVEEVKARLLACIQSTDEKLLEKFKEVLDEDNVKVMEALADYAGKYDAACADIAPDLSADRCPVKLQMELLRHTKAVVTEVARGGEMDVTVASGAFDAITEICKKFKAPEETVTKLQELQVTFSETLIAEATSEDETGDDNLLVLAQKGAATFAALEGREVDEGGDKLCRILTSMVPVMQRLRTADEELNKEVGMNPNKVLKVLQEVKPLWEDVAEVEALQRRLMGVFSKLEDKLAEACEKAVNAGQERKVQALMQYAKDCDEVRESADIHSELLDRLASTHVTAHLTAAEEELNKESGMKTMRVLACIKALPKFWSELDDPAELSTRADGIRTTILTRMETAMEKYLADEITAKVDKLVSFAGECDPNFTGIGLSGDLTVKMKEKSIPDLGLF